MTKICQDETMPSLATVYYWRTRHSEFGEAVLLARQVQAEQLCDEGMDVARAVTPKTAFATDVMLKQVRWTAGALAPARFGRFKLVTQEDVAEAGLEAPAAQETIFYVRQFKAEDQPDGTKKVVAYIRDSRTGLLRREHPEDGEDNTPRKDGRPGEWLPA